jgi:hypothetical protein
MKYEYLYLGSKKDKSKDLITNKNKNYECLEKAIL